MLPVLTHAPRFAALALLGLTGCGAALTEPPDITPPPDAPNTNVVLWLAGHERRDGEQVLHARGKVGSEPVGFELALGPWRENPPGYVNMVTWECNATLRSTGAPSDAWRRFLAGLYGVRDATGPMAERIEVQAFSPWENPGDLAEGEVRFHLLFPPTPLVDRPAEVRIEVDVDDRRVVWKEKERAFRGALVAALGGEADG